MVLMITHDIREAVYLFDRVVVLSPRPATVRRQVPVPLPRPRQLSMVTSPEFAAVEQAAEDAARGVTPGAGGTGDAAVSTAPPHRAGTLSATPRRVCY